MAAISVLIWLAIIVGAFVTAHHIGKGKGRRGWIYALLGGWIGVIILACIGPAVDSAELALVEKERLVRARELDARLAALENK